MNDQVKELRLSDDMDVKQEVNVKHNHIRLNKNFQFN